MNLDNFQDGMWSRNHRMVLPLMALAAVLALGFAGEALATTVVKYVAFSGLQENPPINSNGFGGGSVIIDTNANTLTYRLAFASLNGVESAAHIHGPADPGANAGVVHNLPAGNPKVGVWNYPQAMEADILNGRMYANIHTNVAPGGEIRGQITDRSALLDAAQEVPPNGSAGTGVGVFKLDTAANQLTYYIRTAGLTGAETAAHIHGFALHGNNAGVIHTLPAGNPKIGVFNYAENQEEAIRTGRIYVNVHTAANPGGEIRGQVVPIVVPVERTQEVPPTASTGAGLGLIAYDVGNSQLSYDIRYAGLSGAESAAHIHGFAPPGQNAGVLQPLPLGPRKLGVWNYGAANEQDVFDGLTYINIHTAVNPGGEIRGQIERFNELDRQCADCGPGPHWIDIPLCPAGTDNMPTGALAGIDTNLDCVRDMNIVVTGPALVGRSNPIDDSGNYPGTRPVDGHLDVIDTEMLSMSLTGGGVILTAGAGQGAIPLTASRGTIAEQPGNPNLADSFFDIFFEVDLGGGNRVYNQTPLRINSVIDCVPPHGIYAHPNVCIPLYTHPTPGMGVHVANLVTANHTPYPRPGACCQGPNCVLLTANECQSQNGIFRGEDTVCDPNPCPAGAGGACCIDRQCIMLTAAECAAQGGDFLGDGIACAPDPCGAISSIDDDAPIPTEAAVLLGNVPNPVHSQTTIRFHATGPGPVSLEIFDAAGRFVRRMEREVLSAGTHGLIWDGRDADARPVPTGIYQYKMRIGTSELSGKLNVIR